MSTSRWITILCAVLGATSEVQAQQRAWTQTPAAPRGPAWANTAAAMPRGPVAAGYPATAIPSTAPGPAPTAALTTSPSYYPLPGRPAPTMNAAAMNGVPQTASVPTAQPGASNIVPTAAYAVPRAGAGAVHFTAQQATLGTIRPQSPAVAGRPSALTAQVDPSFGAPYSSLPSGPMTMPSPMPSGSMSPGPMMQPPMMQGPANYGQGPANYGAPYAGPAAGPAPSAAWGLQPDPVSSNYGPANSGPMNYGPMNGGPANFAPQFDQSFTSPACDPPGEEFYPYDPGVRGCGPWFVAASGLIMTRTRPNNVELASLTGDPQISVLNSERVGANLWNGGFETRLGRSIGQRWALEGVYWMIAPIDDQTLVHRDQNDINSRLDFQNLSYQGTPLTAEFNNSREQRLSRHNSFQNIEVNILQQALGVDPAGRFGMMYFVGARYFRFNEQWVYEASSADALLSANNPDTQTNYWIREDNNLVGGQFGGRGYMNLGNRLRLFAMPRFGIFNDRIIQQQHVCMIIDQRSVKNSVALLGQLDAGVSFQILPCCSLYGSYRAMVLGGIATADDNVARSFLSPPAMAAVNSSSSLILHGAQAGLQWQF